MNRCMVMVKQGLGPLQLEGYTVNYCADCVWLSFTPEELPGLVSSSDSDSVRKWVSSFQLVAEGRAASLFLVVSTDLDERSLVLALELDGYGEDADEIITLLILAKKLASMLGSSQSLEVRFRPLGEGDNLLDTLALLIIMRDVDMTHFLKLAGRLEDALAKARACVNALDEIYDELMETEEGAELPEEEEVLKNVTLGDCDRNTLLEIIRSLAKEKESPPSASRVEEGEPTG